MSNQQNMSAIEEGIRPEAALAIGRASMPPPMEVPTIKRILPMSLEFMSCLGVLLINIFHRCEIIADAKQTVRKYYLIFISMREGLGAGAGGFLPVHHWISTRRL